MELIQLSARLDHGMPREPGIGFTLTTSGKVIVGSLSEGVHRLLHGGQGRTRNRKGSLFSSTQVLNFFPSAITCMETMHLDPICSYSPPQTPPRPSLPPSSQLSSPLSLVDAASMAMGKGPSFEHGQPTMGHTPEDKLLFLPSSQPLPKLREGPSKPFLHPCWNVN